MHRHAQYDLYNVALMEKMQARMSPGRSSVNHGEAGERGTVVERMISGPQDFVNRSEMACTKHVMQPGDRMYLPFGVLHSAVTGPHGSVHVTVELEREMPRTAEYSKRLHATYSAPTHAVLLDPRDGLAVNHAVLQSLTAETSPSALLRLTAQVGPSALQSLSAEVVPSAIQSLLAEIVASAA